MTVQENSPATGPDDKKILAHYDADYWAYQKDSGEFGGWALTSLFTPYVTPRDRVVDFGCGGGYVLKNLVCADKLGVEISDAARAVAAENGIRTVASVAQVPDGWADVIISNHALEHVTAPFDLIASLLPKLRPGGTFVCYVPHESITGAWKPNNVDNHLYTWNPMTLGNLFAGAGYEVVSVQGVYKIWPPFYRTIAKAGRAVFEASSYLWGTLKRHNSQVRIVARRPAGGPAR